MTRETRDVWTKRVERWRDSGLTAQEFANEIGVKPDRLRHWKWQLAKERQSVSGTAAAASTPALAEKIAVPFVEVTAPTESKEHEPIEIVAPSGLRVRIPTRFDDETLRRVLSALA